jgi:hypothetical protein
MYVDTQLWRFVYVSCMVADVQEAAAKLAEEKRVAEAEAARIKAEQQKQKEEEVLVFPLDIKAYISQYCQHIEMCSCFIVTTHL